VASLLGQYPSPTKLDENQQAVHVHFAKLYPAAADCFLGAVRVYADHGNPERNCHMAHSVREMMDYVEKNVVAQKQGEGRAIHVRLGDRVKRLLADLVPYRGKIGDPAQSEWPIERQAALSKYLLAVDSFSVNYSGEQQELNLRAELVGLELDPTLAESPAGVRANIAQQWRDLKDFFVGVAHHRPAPSEDVEQRFGELVRFILDRIQPRTFEDQSELLRLIEKGESNANA